MNFRRILYAVSLGVFMAAASVSAQGYLSGAALNKKIVTDFYRLVFETKK